MPALSRRSVAALIHEQLVYSVSGRGLVSLENRFCNSVLETPECWQIIEPHPKLLLRNRRGLSFAATGACRLAKLGGGLLVEAFRNDDGIIFPQLNDHWAFFRCELYRRERAIRP